MKRREFIAGLGAAAAWPLAARAQQAPDRMRRIGVLLPQDENDPAAKAFLSAFTQGLAELGWADGRNMRMEVRFPIVGNVDKVQMYAKDLVDLQPEVIFTRTTPAAKAVQQQTRTIPIIFIGGDPVATGLLGSLSRPEGNATGFSAAVPSIAGKWLELLKEAVPRVTRVELIFDPGSTGVYFAPIEAAAAQYAVAATRAPVRDGAEIERAIAAFAAEPNGGLIVLPPPRLSADRELINRLAIRHRLPAIYFDRRYAAEGGLMSYGTDTADLFRRGASYVDRILRGAKVSDLPVQFPTKFELVINLKTARAMGLEIPPLLLARADEVIE